MENALPNDTAWRFDSSEAFRVTLLSAVPGRVHFRFELVDYDIREKSENGKLYSVATIRGAWAAAEKGKPALPVVRKDFAIAKGRHVRFRVLGKTEERVVCEPPLPSVGMVSREKPVEPAEEDAAIYGGDDVYPLEAVEVGEFYVIRGVEGMEVAFKPMRYDFGSGEMIVTRGLEAEIMMDGAREDDYALRDDEWNFRQLLSRRFANSELLRGGQGMRGIGRLLLVVPDSWREGLADYIGWREHLGFDVEVAGYPSMTGEDSTDIATYIRAAYEETNISHVVLCGGFDALPPKEISRSPRYPSVWSPTTDIPYSWVDGNDRYADVFLSRLSVSSMDELHAVCEKIITYEHWGAVGNWRGDGLFIGSDSTGDYGVTAGRTDSDLLEEERQKLLEGNVIANGNKLFQTERSVATSDVSNYVNVGCSFVYYVGHGYSHRWVVGNFQSNQASALRNSCRLPFVASFCCDTANFAYDTTCLGEAILKNPSGGAIGFFGSTSETYWNPPVYAMRQLTNNMVNRHSQTRLICQGAYTLSSVLAGIDYLATTTDRGQGTSEYFAKQMHLLGDCSAMGRLGRVRNAVFTVARASEDEYAVTVQWEDTKEPVHGAAVCIRSEDGQERFAVRSGEDGVANVPAFGVKSVITVSDSSWGYQEREVDVAAAMDEDADGLISNIEAIRYLNSLGRTAEADDVEAVATAWSRGSGLSMESRMPMTRTPTTGGRKPNRLVDTAAIREPGGDMEPVTETRALTPMVYWSIDDLNARIEELCVLYPTLCHERFVGRSVEGRDIMALRISCLGIDENCPEYLVAAGIHGNERISTWVAMRLAETVLADLAGGEASSVYHPLLSQSALWIVPSMNPDGASYETATRENANGHDMNRSFPDGALQALGKAVNGDSMLTEGYLPIAEYDRQVERFAASRVPETTAFMRFCMEHAFKAALHLHSGSFLVCYPYGNNAARERVYTATTDDEQFIALANAYCNAYDGEMTYKNSCEWYPVDGEAPDWQYRYTGALPLTVELYRNKEPRYLESCESIWNSHERSFPAWLTACMDLETAPAVAAKRSAEDGMTITVTYDTKRLMPDESGRLLVDIGHESDLAGIAHVLNLACEKGLAAEPIEKLSGSVIGARAESDGSVSYLLFSVEPQEDDRLEIGIRPTDAETSADHIASLALLSEESEMLVWRRQLLLAEKRNFTWDLNYGWSFLASPVKGETLLEGDDLKVIHWRNGEYTDAVSLAIDVFQPCRAMWVFSEKSQRLIIEGRMGVSGPVLRPGWNAIGSLYYEPLKKTAFVTEGRNYVSASGMLPGAGYWIFVK